MRFLTKFLSGRMSAAPSQTPRHQAPDVPTSEPRIPTESVDPYLEFKKEGGRLLDSGLLRDAEAVYRKAIEIAPSRSEAHLNLGYALFEQRIFDGARGCFDEAIALDPDNFDAHLLRGRLALEEDDLPRAQEESAQAQRVAPTSPEATALHWQALASQGAFSAIESALQDTLKVAPDSLSFHIQAATALAGVRVAGKYLTALIDRALGHLDAAQQMDSRNPEVPFQRARLMRMQGNIQATIVQLQATVERQPNHAVAFLHLAIAYRELGDKLLAEENLNLSIRANPKFPSAHKLLGDIYYEQALPLKARVSYESALKFDPTLFETELMLALVLSDLGIHEEALKSCERAISLRPDVPDVYLSLGNALAAKSHYPAAIDAYRKALKLRPDYVAAWINMGVAMLSLSNYAAALEAFRQVLEYEPSHLMALGNITYASSFNEECSPQEYLARARRFGEAATSLAKPFASWSRDPELGACVKVGIVSGDLGMHPVGFFLESVLSYLEEEKVQIHAFSNFTFPSDALQKSLKTRVETWTDIADLNDEAAAKVIHDAQIDVLLDLSGHTGKNRLPLFSWRPAPVQATWLGYWGSTGVAEMDFVMADPHSVPAENQSQFSEKVRYFPHSRLCFTPPSAVYAMPVASAPVLKSGRITFGSFQPLRKLTPVVLSLWGRIASQVPDAMFRLQGSGFTETKTRETLLARLASAGIDECRVTFSEGMPRLQYLYTHQEVDILLDTFPYPGGTTTCDALWMGVPTVTLAGNTMLSRQGVSLNMCAGLADWIANTHDEYVQIAVAKARQVPELVALRARLRQQVFECPLFDAPGFGRAFGDCMQSVAKETGLLT